MAVFAKLLSVVEIGILLVAAGCGMAASIMIGITMNQFGCILKAGVEDVGGDRVLVHYSEISRCNYCLLIQIVALLLALAFGIYRVLVLCSGKYDIKVFGRFIVSIVFGVLTFLMLIEACLVSVGLNTFCANMLAVYTTTSGCRTFQQTITWAGDVNGSHFYDNFKVAESVSWIGVLLWLSMTVLCIVSHCIYKRERPHAPSTIPVKANKTPGMAGPV